MGMVYQAEDIHLQRQVALKVMKADVARDPKARERFLREARAGAKLKSDHVVTIHHVGEDRQVVFLAMELLEGLSLDDWLKKGRKPTLAQAARMGRQIALGLAAAHERGLMHRDVKPGNIWLESSHQGRVKLLDFGLARGPKEDVQLTQSGAIVGTPAYMAPEQARGEKVDHRADLFSLGVVLYRLTTGCLPFQGDNTMALLMALAVDTPKPPREINADIPPRLAALVERLLAKDPGQRPQTAKGVADELAAIEREAAQPAADERTTQVRAATARERAAQTAPWRSRLRWLVAASLLFVLGGATLGIIVIIRDKQGKKIAEIDAPDGASVETRGNGKDQTEANPAPSPKEVVPVAASPLAPFLPSTPLSSLALVQRPAKLSGVRSWSIESRSFGTAISPAAYRPDGQRLAVGSRDGVIRIWETQTGRLVQVLYAPSRVWSLAWSPDGRVLAAGLLQDKHPIQLWQAETGRFLRALEMPSDMGSPILAWARDGQTLLAGFPSWCYIWQAADGKLVRKLPVPGVVPAAFSPDGKFLAGLPSDRSGVLIWDTLTGHQVRKLTAYKDGPGQVSWSPDGKRLGCAGHAAGGSARDVLIWDAESGKETAHVKELLCYGVIWSPDGRPWALNPLNNNWTRLIEVSADPGRQTVEECGGPWSPDGKTVVGMDPWTGTVHLVDAGTGKRLRTLSETPAAPPFYFRLSPDGRTVATLIGPQTVLSSMDTGQVVAVLKDAGGWALAWSPDGKQLATTGPDNALLLWTSDGKTRRSLVGHRDKVNSVAWSPDGKTLASTSFDKRVYLWDAESGERRSELGPVHGKPDWVAWSPDGRHVAFHDEGAGWQVWDVKRNKLVNDPKQWAVSCFLFAPDGRSVLTAAVDGSAVRLRELATGKDLAGPSSDCTWSPPATPSWSADGGLFAVGRGPTVELWRGDLRHRLRTLKSTSGNIEHFLAFSPDGKLVAGRAGNRLHLWETDTGQLRGILLLGEENNGLTITPDGHYTGNQHVDRGIAIVVQKDDGTQEVLEPGDFEQKYGFKNEPNKVHLLQPLPPSLYPQPGQPMGPNVLVRQPAELPDANSWTIETVNPRGLVRAVAYRPDGKLLATGGSDSTIRIWDATSGKLLRMLVGGPVETLALSWSKDGMVLAAVGGAGAALWDVDSGRLLRHLAQASAHIAWSPDARTLAMLDANGCLRLWDVASVRWIGSHEFKPVGRGLAWSPDGKTIAVAVADLDGTRVRTLRLWDVASGKEVRKLEGIEAPCIHGIAWSKDGKRVGVIASHGEQSSYVWDVTSGKLQGRLGPIPQVDWSPDGNGAIDGPRLFDGAKDQPTPPLEVGGLILALALSPDGKQVATAGPGGVVLHDAVSGKRKHELEESFGYGGIYTLNWSPDGRRLAFGTNLALLRIVEAATGRAEQALTEFARAGAWSPDSKTFAAVGRDNSVCLLDAATSRLLRTLEVSGEAAISAMAWSPDGKLLAVGGSHRLWVCSTETGKQLWRDGKHSHCVCLAWSPDGRRLATTDNGEHQALCLWDADTGKLRHEWPLAWETQAAWSPDGKTLAAGPGEHAQLLLIDAASETVRVRVKEDRRYHVHAIRWSPDGKTFSAIDRGEALRTYDVASGKLLRTQPLDWGNGIGGWSPDGRVLAWGTASAVHLFDAGGRPLGVLLPFDEFGRLAVTADGRYRGNARVERTIRMVVQKSDGTTETLTPRDFEQKYGFKNDPAEVRLIDK
jgi:WD40 repeat protein